jgi:beta-fructofuranosidase
MTTTPPQTKALSDPQRPAYHFLPLKNWMNDPNGLIQFKGEYHLFYQHNPEAPVHGPMHWGHAVSRDLVHWQHLPIALSPTPGGPDAGGIWSGCAVNDGGVPTLIYTGVHPETQCIATASADMRTFTKYAGNPVIAGPPEGLEVTGFRDPYVWKQGDTWFMALGSGIKDLGGAILVYRSKDLRAWEYLHPALVGEAEKTGAVWECPNVFPLGGKWVLIMSTLGRAHCLVGSFVDQLFSPECDVELDRGGCLYAPQTFADERGRRVMFGWLWENREDASDAGWQGLQSLPRVLSLGADGRLRYTPAKELEALRYAHASVTERTLPPGELAVLPGIEGDCLELQMEIDPGDAEKVSLAVRRSPGGEEQTLIVYDAERGRLGVVRERSSQDPKAEKSGHTTPFALANGEALRLRVFVDRSVVEVFANERACLTCRIYPSRADSLGVALSAEGGTAVVKSLDAWRMRSVWD